MSLRQLVVLGTASQAPTRLRAHNGYALRWDDQLILFDPGEGTQRQCILAGIKVMRLTAVCLTHFHGDHCLGLPGVLQRRALDNSSARPRRPPLPVYFPADGRIYFDRLRGASIYYDTRDSRPVPIGRPGPIGSLGAACLRAAALDHRVTALGYRIDEPDGVRLVPERLEAVGVWGRDVGRLVADGAIEIEGRRVTLDEVSVPRPGQSVAFIMDTRPCNAALALADGADLLICESTYLHAEARLAYANYHMTARQAGELAAAAGARRLVLTHFSSRYPDSAVFGEEAAAYHSDVVVAEDLVPIDVPPRRR